MKVHFTTLGCPKNQVDSELMLGMLQQGGHHISDEAESADCLVVNTCAFIDRAREESVNTILELADQQVPLIQVLREMATAVRDLLPKEKLEVMLGVPARSAAMPPLARRQLIPSAEVSTTGPGPPDAGVLRGRGLKADSQSWFSGAPLIFRPGPGIFP